MSIDPREQHAATTALREQVDAGRREIRTDGYAMSIGELASLYEDGEMIIYPRFQRFFRWTAEQKARLIESILLGIPLPQIFLSQRDDGVWEVVDGLQRLSTVFEFMGKLNKEHDATAPTPPPLAKVKYLPALEGMTWDRLPKELNLDFRRTKMNISIILRGGDARAKYELFQRLNTGGSPLSEQEVRNCVLIMENEGFFEWIEELSRHDDFAECVAISDRLTVEGYHMELASRLIVFSMIDIDELQGDVGTLVTDKLINMAKMGSENRTLWSNVFTGTFSILARAALGNRVFKRYSEAEGRFKGGFLLSPFEVVACGIAHHLANGVPASRYSDRLVLSRAKSMWSDEEFRIFARSGLSATYRLRSSIAYGRNLFEIGSLRDG